MVNRLRLPELKLSKEVAIQGFTLFEVGALVGTLLWGWLSDSANGRRALVACVALALIIATLGVYQHASNQYVYLASLFALGFTVFGPQLLIGVAAVGFVPKKPSALRTVSREPSLILSAIALPSWVWA